MNVIPAIRRQRREDVFAFWVYTCSRLANASYANYVVSPVNKKEEVEWRNFPPEDRDNGP